MRPPNSWMDTALPKTFRPDVEDLGLGYRYCRHSLLKPCPWPVDCYYSWSEAGGSHSTTRAFGLVMRRSYLLKRASPTPTLASSRLRRLANDYRSLTEYRCLQFQPLRAIELYVYNVLCAVSTCAHAVDLAWQGSGLEVAGAVHLSILFGCICTSTSFLEVHSILEL